MTGRIRTGSIGIDKALGGGWLPGTLNEVWGDPGAGKTVLALHTVESVVRAGKDVLWIDTVDGVRHMDSAPRVIVARPRNAEDAFTMAEHATRWRDIGLVVFDSANYLVRQRELDGDPDYVPHPQREYRLELSSLKTRARAGNTLVLFVSQPRDKERQPVRGTGISEKVMWRVHLHPDVIHQDASRVIQATVKHVPSKVTVHDVARFTIRPGQGIDQADELVRAAIEWGVLVPNGSWLRYDNGYHRVQCQGVAEMARALRDIPVMMDGLDHAVRIKAGIS